MSKEGIMQLDLHTHSCHSHDAITRPETLLRTAKEAGIGFAITDHGTTAAWDALKKLNRKYNVPLIFGEEVYTTFNGRGAGELIGLFLQSGIKAREYPEVIDEIKSQGGLVVVPHPFDFLRSNFKHLEKVRGKVDLIEVLNSRCYVQRFNRKAMKYAEQHSLAGSAGSDAHTPEEFGNAYVQVEASALEEARKNIVKGKAEFCGRGSGICVHIKTALAKKGIIKSK